MKDRTIGANMRNPSVDHDWLALRREDVLEPDQRIIDAHHHMWDRPGWRYLPPDMLLDIHDGHRVVATVHVEDEAGYRSYGPADMRPVGETEIMAGLGHAWSSQDPQVNINAAIVGYADLILGDAVRPVLEAHMEAGQGRFRGIRHITAWDADETVQTPLGPPRRTLVEGMIPDPRFRQGFAHLGQMGLTFDAWVYHPQLGELADLADAFPQTTIVVNHIGGIIRTGSYRDRLDETFAQWRAAVSDIARRPNVLMKIGGLGMQLFGFDLRDRPVPASSEYLAGIWEPFANHCIEAFGPERCMFESNFPVDMAFFTYRTMWNAFKRLAAGASSHEKDLMFYETAARTYRLAAPPD
ncbi:MAG: amidohydrolase family protein [Rhizobiaceae bacterium]|nr:amidohydrolase family protein [Rhizobiaceae bacterium]